MITLALILIPLSVKMSTKKKEAKSWCEKVHLFLMIFVLRKREVLKKRRREQLSQNTDSHSPVVCVCGLILWVPWVISEPAAHESWGLLALRPLRHFRSLWRRIAHCASLLSGTDGAVARLGKEVCFAISHAKLFLSLKRGSRLQSCQSGTFHWHLKTISKSILKMRTQTCCMWTDNSKSHSKGFDCRRGWLERAGAVRILHFILDSTGPRWASVMFKLSASIRERSYKHKTHGQPLSPVSNFCNTINPFVFISSFCKHFSI